MQRKMASVVNKRNNINKRPYETLWRWSCENVINVSCPIVSLCRTVIFNWIYGIENNPWNENQAIDSEIVGLNILINRIHDCHYKFHCSFIHWFTLNVFNSFIILASFFCYFEHLQWNNLIKFEHLLILIIEENIL